MQSNPDKTSVYILIEEEEEEFAAYRLKGGQRLLIPEEAREKIINALLTCKQVTLRVGRYKETLSPEGFNRSFARLIHLQ
jgi:hypothetical protein